MMSAYKHKITNPFTGEVQNVSIDLTTETDKAELDALKKCMKDYLTKALKREDFKVDKFKLDKMQYLIVQLYQPSTLTALAVKLMKFSEYLEGVKEFDDVFKTVKVHSSEITIADLYKY